MERTSGARRWSACHCAPSIQPSGTIVTGTASTAANGTIEVQSVSVREPTAVGCLRAGRRLAIHSSRLPGGLLDVGGDIDANGVVEQTDIEMFTYYLLNRQALDYSAFCLSLRQWLDPTLDGRANTKD